MDKIVDSMPAQLQCQLCQLQFVTQDCTGECTGMLVSSKCCFWNLSGEQRDGAFVPRPVTVRSDCWMVMFHHTSFYWIEYCCDMCICFVLVCVCVCSSPCTGIHTHAAAPHYAATTVYKTAADSHSTTFPTHVAYMYIPHTAHIPHTCSLLKNWVATGTWRQITETKSNGRHACSSTGSLRPSSFLLALVALYHTQLHAMSDGRSKMVV